jgi:hypothetical protein
LLEKARFSGLFDTEQNQTIGSQTNFKTGALNRSASLPDSGFGSSAKRFGQKCRLVLLKFNRLTRGMNNLD